MIYFRNIFKKNRYNLMFRRLFQITIEHSLNSAYKARLSQRGCIAEGVFWRNKSAQFARFDALLKHVQRASPKQNTTLTDVGCGYGALYEFIKATPKYQHLLYTGVDINSAMIKACKQHFPNERNLFSIGRKPKQLVDFSLFSGTFNLCHTHKTKLWEEYIFENLHQSWQLSRYGITLNLLCDKQSHIRNQIYYANRARFIESARNLFGPTYANSTPQVTGDVTFTILRK